MNDKKDNLFATPLDRIADFAFDQSVVQVFDDMLNRSIPGYGTVIHQVGAFARRFVQPETCVFDLGCSLGAATFAVRHSVGQPGCRIVAVDNSAEMIARLESRLARDVGVLPVELRCEDVRDTAMESTSLVVMNFTLQFIDFADKGPLIERIFASLNKGGALVLSEKVVQEDSAAQSVVEDLYFDFKRFNGYNDLEISQKRDALENVLKLDTPRAHAARLEAVGFSHVQEWFRALNFVSYVAVK